MSFVKKVYSLAGLTLLETGLTVAHSGPEETGGVMGYCTSGTPCHALVDSFGHGLLGTGWIGFFIVFGIWIFGTWKLIQLSMNEWAEKEEAN